MFFAILYALAILAGTTYYDGNTGTSQIISATEPMLIDYPVPAYLAMRSPRPIYKNAEEVRLEKIGLVNVREYIPNIVVRLSYASHQNVLGVKLYEYNEAYLLPSAALKLSNAQHLLSKTRPGTGLVVYEAARPQAVQKKCWDFATAKGLQYLFAPPTQVSMHSYGVAVDVCLIDLATYKELDMGSPIDVPGKMASTQWESQLASAGLLNHSQINNRLLLRNVMRAAGFIPHPNEWWHFEAFSRYESMQHFSPIP
ncbi:D-alanyl-D-alanine dipeptidase [Bacteroidia bacterium]|nr:D-alanyl-D-alanine dipeptidase [Bacteroidia bacterium]